MTDENGHDESGSFRDGFALTLIRHKYEVASEVIKTRLAFAMLLRRRRFLYRRARYRTQPTKIAQSIGKIDTSEKLPKLTSPSISLSRSELKKSIRPTTLAPSFGTTPSRAATATTFYPDRFKQAAAPSLRSSAKSTPILEDANDLLPPMPKSKDGVDSVCPYCFLVLLNDEDKDTKRWR